MVFLVVFLWCARLEGEVQGVKQALQRESDARTKASEEAEQRRAAEVQRLKEVAAQEMREAQHKWEREAQELQGKIQAEQVRAWKRVIPFSWPDCGTRIARHGDSVHMDLAAVQSSAVFFGVVKLFTFHAFV